SVVVLFVDYGNSQEVGLGKAKEVLAPLNKKLASLPLITKQYRLGGVCMPPDVDDRYAVLEALTQLVGESAEVLMFCDSTAPVPSYKEDKKPVPVASLFLTSSGSSSSSAATVKKQDIGEILLTEGLVYMDKARMPVDQRLRYDEAQTAAKKSRLNIWRNGDCRPDD
ncbi:nuclease domain-containing protein, partial [Cichlidogyrus casuarinus]